MNHFRRAVLFLFVNFLVMSTVGLITWAIGANQWLHANGLDIASLMLFSFVWGFGGALLSLFLSAWIAKTTMGVQIISVQDGGKPGEIRDLVYTISKKAGLSHLPAVGIYRSPELNAFATGASQKRALVAVSTGLIQSMSETELRAVLAHEISHIRNGDMVTMTLLQGLVNAFVLFLSRLLAYAITMVQRRDSENRTGGMFWILTYIFDILFMALGNLVVAAYSRWREFRADRGSADLEGASSMIQALQALQRYSDVQDPLHDRPAVAAFKISSGLGSWFRWYATHPPLSERIHRLEALASVSHGKE